MAKVQSLDVDHVRDPANTLAAMNPRRPRAVDAMLMQPFEKGTDSTVPARRVRAEAGRPGG
ncbi:MAG: hypothetical protein AMXMBFR6_19450 [Betaproteobacteria bacterium]